jgi:hypothetical protein
MESAAKSACNTRMSVHEADSVDLLKMLSLGGCCLTSNASRCQQLLQQLAHYRINEAQPHCVLPCAPWSS